MPELLWESDGDLVYTGVETGLASVLEGIFPDNNIVALDTETSGLFVDGDWKDAPPARVSVVSLTWDSYDAPMNTMSTVSVAIPFDQGWVGGKPGKWSDELDGYERLDHTQECRTKWHDGTLADGECVCAPWNFGAEDWEALCLWLSDKLLVMQNAKYDLHIMNAGLRTVPDSGFDLEPRLVWDTMISQGIIEPLHTSSLKPTAERLWGISSRDEENHVKAALKKNGVGLTWRYDLLGWHDIAPYACKDTDLTLRLFKRHQDLIAEGVVDTDDRAVIEQDTKLARLLFKMECRGVGFDVDLMRSEAVKMRKTVSEIKVKLEALFGEPVNVNSAKRYFFDTLGLMPIKVTPKGAPSLDTEVAARLAADGVEGADLWVHLANMNSALSKWYNAWPYKAGPDGRLRTNFRQGRVESDRKGMTSGGAISGRLSAERIQLQGVPDDYKLPKEIVPPKKMIRGKVAYCSHCDETTTHEVHEVDVSTAEVMVAAWLLQSPTLAAACATGNVHSANTVSMFNIDESHPEWGMYRKIAKTTVLGLFFGAGVRTLKSQVELATKKDYPEREVKRFIEMTHAIVPELRPVSRAMQRKADKALGGQGFIRLVNGRKRWYGWAEHTHKAFNSGTQGGVAETMKQLMLMVEAWCPGMLINQVHDSLWLEVCPCRAEFVVPAVIAMGEKLFTETFSTENLAIPFGMDAKMLA